MLQAKRRKSGATYRLHKIVLPALSRGALRHGARPRCRSGGVDGRLRGRGAGHGGKSGLPARGPDTEVLVDEEVGAVRVDCCCVSRHLVSTQPRLPVLQNHLTGAHTETGERHTRVPSGKLMERNGELLRDTDAGVAALDDIVIASCRQAEFLLAVLC